MISPAFLRFNGSFIVCMLCLSIPLCLLAADNGDTEEDLPKERTSVWDLMMSGSLPEIKAFLDNDDTPEPLDWVTEGGGTLLHLAALRGSAPIIRMLVEDYFLEADAVTRDGWSPLHIAVEQGHYEAAAVLARALDGDFTFSPVPPLYLAALRGDVRMLWLLYGAGHDLDFTTPSGANVLHVVAQEGDVNALHALLAMGAGEMIDRQDDQGWTPLFAAALNGREDVVALLIQAGAGVNRRTEWGLSALDIAARKRHKSILGRLLIGGAGPGLFNEEAGITPLHLAALYGDLDTLRLLVDAGGDLRQGDSQGVTPLEYACRAFAQGVNREALLRVMIYIHAYVQEHTTLVPLAERPALIMDGGPNARLLDAAWLGDSNAVTELLREGANPFYADALGRTVLHAAVAGVCVDVLQTVLLAQEHAEGGGL